MVSGMSGFHGDKRAATCGADFVVRNQFAFDYRAIIGRLNHARNQMYGFVRWRRPEQFDCVIRGYGAGRSFEAAWIS